MRKLRGRNRDLPKSLYLILIDNAVSRKKEVLGRPLSYWRSKYLSSEEPSPTGADIVVLGPEEILREFSRQDEPTAN